MTDEERIQEVEAAAQKVEDALTEYFGVRSGGALLTNWVVLMGGYQPENYGDTAVSNLWVGPLTQPIYTTLGLLDFFTTKLHNQIAPPVVIFTGGHHNE